MRAYRLAVQAIEALNGAVGRMAAVSLLGLIGLVVWEVFQRYVLQAPTTWSNELVGYVFAGYILLGGGYTLLHRDHVAMDILYARLSPRAQATLDVLTAGFVMIYCAVLLRETAVMAYEAWETGQRANSDWSPPLFPIYLVLPVGAALILLQAVAKLVRDLHMAFTGQVLLPEPKSMAGEEPAL